MGDAFAFSDVCFVIWRVAFPLFLCAEPLLSPVSVGISSSKAVGWPLIGMRKNTFCAARVNAIYIIR